MNRLRIRWKSSKEKFESCKKFRFVNVNMICFSNEEFLVKWFTGCLLYFIVSNFIRFPGSKIKRKEVRDVLWRNFYLKSKPDHVFVIFKIKDIREPTNFHICLYECEIFRGI